MGIPKSPMIRRACKANTFQWERAGQALRRCYNARHCTESRDRLTIHPIQRTGKVPTTNVNAASEQRKQKLWSLPDRTGLLFSLVGPQLLSSHIQVSGLLQTPSGPGRLGGKPAFTRHILAGSALGKHSGPMALSAVLVPQTGRQTDHREN